MSFFSQITIGDGANLDAFSRLRVSNTEELFSVQSQYDAEPLQMEAGNTGDGVAPAYSASTRMVELSSAAGTGTSFMQSYQYSPYEPGRSQFIAITGVIGAGVAGATVDTGYFDAGNGVILRQNGVTNLQLILRTSTSGSVSDANIVAQADWNVDKMNGTGQSGITFDVTKSFILIIDLQFLGMGRVRVGVDIDGILYYIHEFLNANVLAVPYMQTATLPIQMLLTTTATAAPKSCFFKCATVQSEGGNTSLTGLTNSTPESTATAGNGTRTPLAVIRPKLTFNSIANRSLFEILGVNIISTGTSPVYWEIVAGGAYAGQTFADVDAVFSAYEYASVPGTFTNLTGGIVFASGYAPAGGGGVSSGTTVGDIKIPTLVSRKIPLTLDRAGALRALGVYTVLVTGIGGTSACRGSIIFKEVR